MHHRPIVALILALVGVKGISAEESSATLSELVDGADRIAVGDVGTMRRVIEEQVVHTKDGEEITGKFIFTYVDVTPTEHRRGSGEHGDRPSPGRPSPGRHQGHDLSPGAFPVE